MSFMIDFNSTFKCSGFVWMYGTASSNLLRVFNVGWSIFGDAVLFDLTLFG